MHCWKGFLLASCLALLPAQEREVATGKPQVEAVFKRPADAEALLAHFGKMKGLEVAFTEKKHIALLAVPLESSGSLYFLPPGYLTRVVATPTKSKLTITPSELRMSNRDGEEVMDLRQNVEVRSFVTSLVQVFAGDREALLRSYELKYSLGEKDDSAWSLKLRPLKKPLTEMMKSLRLDGRGPAVERIELVEPNGDRTVTIVSAVNAKREFSDKEKLELFGIDKLAPADETPR